ncbi:MAG: endolytic transglycosylase MltG [Bacteroidaceae bacterium]|nr:endolytic transglycosylase MltG [Bacteroidaceae bacterium]
MTKTHKYILIGALAIAGIVVAVALWSVHAVMRPPFELSETAYIYIRPSTTEADVLDQLEAECHARSLTGWRLLRMVTDFKPRTGRYAVNPEDDMLTVLRRLRNGQQEPVRLTIPSVRRLNRLAGVLSQKLMLDSAEVATAFADSSFAAEWGYTTPTLPALFIPNTYELFWNISLDAFMQRMQRENDAFWNSQGRDAAAKSLGMTHEEVVTLASIVDEETAYTPEKPRVAGVYLNRLRIGMLLQADPTVKFAVGDDGLRRILNQHLRIQSPYNTYIYIGLPPGPIRIPSISGIDAVLKAESHPFLYFCAKEDFSGSHNFARTWAEHLQNARRYQRALNARGIR